MPALVVPGPSPRANAAPDARRRQRLVPPRSVLARQRGSLARQALARCELCLHRCGSDRLAGPAGRCHAGPDARFFGAQIDVSDELELLPSFAVSLAGCNLRCDFCITGAPSWNARAGSPVDAEELARQATDALRLGARTVMILGGEPTIHLPSLLALIAALPDDATLVLKTNAGFTDRVRPFLAGLVDVWLPDLKFGNAECARRLAAIPPAAEYWTTATSNLRWMAEQTDTSETIVRHLLMPGHLECCWEPAARWLAREIPDVKVSLRSGYWPAWHADRHLELRRPVPRSDFERARTVANDLGLRLVP